MANPQVIRPGDEDDQVHEVPMTSDALAILNKSEIEQQVEIARKYPRSIDAFRKKLDQYTNLSESIALSMFYSLKRRSADGTEKIIPGPSVRFAETVLPCWGNSRAGIRILGEQGNVAVAQGLFFDCESNVGINVEAQRSILDKNNKKFKSDMIVMTGNAAGSIAYRNAILRCVPRALYLDIYEKCKRTAVGEAISFATQVSKAVEEFSKQGVTQVALLNALGAPSIRDITADHILAMRAMFSDIQKGDKTIEDVFGSPEDDEIDAAMVELGWNASKQTMSKQAHKGRRSEHLDMLRAELAKKGRVATTPAKGQKATAGEMAQGRAAVSEQPPEGDTTTQTAGSSATSAPETVVKAEASKPTEEEAW